MDLLHALHDYKYFTITRLTCCTHFTKFFVVYAKQQRKMLNFSHGVLTVHEPAKFIVFYSLTLVKTRFC